MPTKIFISVMIIWLSASHVFSWPIPDTGQIQCFDNSAQIDCPEPGNDFYGQDAHYIFNPPSYTKLDETGQPLPDYATSWVMIQDNHTGLIWEVQTEDSSIHDKYKTYEWNDAKELFIAHLNDTSYCGIMNWRLPKALELASIMNLHYHAPVLDPIFNGISQFYWSSVPTHNTDGIWGVNFNNGIVKYITENELKSVRAVYQESIDISNNWIIDSHTIIDKRSGLMWQRETFPSALNWKDALAHCENLTLDNYSDWRLPNIKEILSIVDFAVTNPAIYSEFPTQSAFYWSSTSHTQNYYKAWGVEFDFGSTANKEKILLHYVRAVRGGQQPLLNHVFIHSPRQGDIWNEGNVIPIIWDTSNIAGNVKILISDNGGKSFTPIVLQTTNDGQYDWSAPFLLSSSNCFLKIQPIDAPEKANSVGLFTIEGISLSLMGLLTDENDRPITSTTFSINGKNIMTDVDGNYECTLSVFQAGTYDLLYWINNYQAKLFEDITLKTNEPNILNAKIPNIISLEGHIYNFLGEIISDATVTVQNKTQQTDDKGYFQFDKLDSGSTTMYISHPDYYSLTETLEIIPGKSVSLNAELMRKGGVLNFVTNILPKAIVGQTYQSRIKANGTMPLTYSLIKGSFPEGIEMNSQSGVLYGTATTAGVYTFTLSIHDAINLYAEREFTIDAFDTLTFNTHQIYGMTTQESYTLNLLAKGGLPPYTFNIIAGSLPEGITLSQVGQISGVPQIWGHTNITVQVTDSIGGVEYKDYEIHVYDPLTLLQEKQVDGMIGQSLTIELPVTGGNGNYLWSIDSDLLPDGLTVDNAIQSLTATETQPFRLTGTLNQAVNKTITLFVTDSEGRKSFCNLTFNIVSVLEFITLALPDALKNTPYSESIPVKGGIAPYTFTCKGLQSNLTYNYQTGLISGSSIVIGYDNINIQVTDSTQPESQTINMTMGLRTQSNLTILTNSVLPKCMHGENLDPIILKAGGGQPPYTWSSEDLPEGIYLNPSNGTLSGTLLTLGLQQSKIFVQDAQNQISEKEFFWHIIKKLEIITNDLGKAYENIFYSQNIDVIGGIPPYIFQLKAGAMLSGFILNENGLIYGQAKSLSMPQQFTIEVMDSDIPHQTTVKGYQIETKNNFSLEPSRIPEARVNHAYLATIKAMLGNPPYNWNIGNVPHGLTYTVNLDTVTIEGTAQAPGSFTWIVEVTDSSIPMNTVKNTYQVKIYDQLAIQTSWLKTATTNVYYTDTIQVIGGKPPYILRIIDSELPQGLSLDSQTGELFGTIHDSDISDISFKVVVQDSFISPSTIEHILTFSVNNDLNILTETIPDATQYQYFSTTLFGGGGLLPYQWQIKDGKLPHCVYLNEFTGRIQGHPNTAGVFTLDIELIDQLDARVRKLYNWTVKPVKTVGDLNDDKKLDLSDLILSLQYISNINNDQICSFDINNNCYLELTEVLFLINKILR